MRKLFTIAALVVAFVANAQIRTFDPRTGDITTDNVLKDINTKAQKDIETFSKSVSDKFGIIKSKVDQMVKIMSPGDVYMAAQTAEITKKPIDEVTKSYEANKDKGWGAIAKEMGIKPGSPEFHALKNKVKEHGNSGKGQGNKGGKGKGKGNAGGKAKGGDDEHGKDHAEQGKDHSDKAPKENKGGGKGKGHGKGKE